MHTRDRRVLWYLYSQYRERMHTRDSIISRQKYLASYLCEGSIACNYSIVLPQGIIAVWYLHSQYSETMHTRDSIILRYYYIWSFVVTRGQIGWVWRSGELWVVICGRYEWFLRSPGLPFRSSIDRDSRFAKLLWMVWFLRSHDATNFHLS